MIYLATGAPSANIEGDQIAVTIPSGTDSVTIALDLHQAMKLAKRTERAAIDIFDAVRQRPVAEILPFARRA